MRFPLVVKHGSVETDAVVKIEVAYNDPVRALSELTWAYQDAWAKIVATVPVTKP